jgi:glycosyltransferase involved in cell wall biosynthesis
MKESSDKYILLIIAPAGAHLKNFLERIEHAASSIHIITSKPLSLETNYPVTFVDFGLKKPSNYYQTPRKIREIFKAFKPDIVHVHQLNSVAYFSFKGLKGVDAPVVCTAWGSDVLVLPDKNPLLKKMVQSSIRQSSAITSDSIYMADRIKELAHPKEVDMTICNFGVSKPLFELPKEKIIYSNRLHKPLYRIDKIIHSFYKFSKTPAGEDWRLIVGAVGSETDKLKNLVSEFNLNEKVEFVGWLEKEDNMRWYAKAKVWVSVPESDATAISLLEAMYNGCYPVVIDLPASHEWIKSTDQGRIVKDVDSCFFEHVEKVNFEKAALANVELIKKEATYEVSEKKFESLHRRLIANK